jgi:hypothetical protein
LEKNTQRSAVLNDAVPGEEWEELDKTTIADLTYDEFLRQEPAVSTSFVTISTTTATVAASVTIPDPAVLASVSIPSLFHRN